jgi:2'-5' RNA ligase
MWEAAGCSADPRPPLAHVTLARPMRRATTSEVAQAVSWAKGLKLEGATVQLDRIALYTWTQDRTNALFQVVAELPLPAADGGEPGL